MLYFVDGRGLGGLFLLKIRIVLSMGVFRGGYGELQPPIKEICAPFKYP